MSRLLADENLPFPVVEELRRRGHDVVTLADLGVANQALADEAVLVLARDDGRALATLNRKHFVRIHNTDPNHAGIVVCAVDRDFVGLATRIDSAIARLPALDGQLVRIDRASAGSGA